MRGDWIDVSVPLCSGMVVWPKDPPVRIERVRAIREGAPANVSVASLGLHTGTHVDAPVHFLDGRASIGEMPAGALVGPARVVAIRDPKAVRVRALEGLRIRRGERILFRTRNSTRCWRSSRFCSDYVYVALETARYLAARGVAAVGVDYLSVGAPNEEGYEVHRVLMRAGVWIIEGLDLSKAPVGRCDLVCLPLKVRGADGAPARAVVRGR
jgi:arylformamidase